MFATFLLLSYSKLLYQLLLMVDLSLVLNFSVKEYYQSLTYVILSDNSIKWGSVHYAINVTVAGVIAVIFNLLPMLLLALYPVSIFRRMLSKCKLDRGGLMIFMEKFQSCYKDRLDGGRDMRSFNVLPFLLKLVVAVVPEVVFKCFKIDHWLLRGVIFCATAILVALCRPYKKTYRTVCDTLLLTHLALLCFTFLSNTDRIMHYQQFIESMLLLPFAIFAVVIVMKLVFRLKAICIPHLQRTLAGPGPDGSRQRLIQWVSTRSYGT